MSSNVNSPLQYVILIPFVSIINSRLLILPVILAPLPLQPFFFFFFYAINAILYLINKIKQKVRKYIVTNTKAEANHANAKF